MPSLLLKVINKICEVKKITTNELLVQLEKNQANILATTTNLAGRYDMVCPAISAWDLHKAFGQQLN